MTAVEIAKVIINSKKDPNLSRFSLSQELMAEELLRLDEAVREARHIISMFDDNPDFKEVHDWLEKFGDYE